MNYINTQTLEYPVTIAQIKAAFPNTSFPIPFVPPLGFAEVRAAVKPSHNHFTHKVVEGAPIQYPDGWTQVWQIVALTPEEAAAMVPASVTRRQAKQALLLAGLLGQVQPAIDAIADPTQRALIQIEWDDSQVFERDRPALIALGTALGLDSLALDALFIQASQL